MATTEELVVQFRAETDEMRREIQQMQQQITEFTNNVKKSSKYYHTSLENMGNANSEYSQKLRQMKYEQREAMKPHIEELKRTKLAYLELGMSLGNYQGSTKDLIRGNSVGSSREKGE